MPCAPPRPGRPSRPRWSHRPSSRSGPAPARLQAIPPGCHPDAASCPRTASSVVCADARPAASIARPGPPYAAGSSSTCNPSETRAASADARENASRSSRRTRSGIDRASIQSRPPVPVWLRPCPAAGPTARTSLLPRSAAGNGGIAAPRPPEPPPPPLPTAPAAPSGSKRP
jgi:hypothetical protein